jgi:hypothetical protein
MIRRSLVTGCILSTLAGCGRQAPPAASRPAARDNSSPPAAGTTREIHLEFHDLVLAATRPAPPEQEAVRFQRQYRTTSEQVLGWKGHVRGELEKGPAARVLIVLDINGVKRSIEFPYDESGQGTFTRDFWVPACYTESNYQITVRLKLSCRDADADATAKVTSLEMVPVLAR